MNHSIRDETKICWKNCFHALRTGFHREDRKYQEDSPKKQCKFYDVLVFLKEDSTRENLNASNFSLTKKRFWLIFSKIIPLFEILLFYSCWQYFKAIIPCNRIFCSNKDSDNGVTKEKFKPLFFFVSSSNCLYTVTGELSGILLHHRCFWLNFANIFRAALSHSFNLLICIKKNKNSKQKTRKNNYVTYKTN